MVPRRTHERGLRTVLICTVLQVKVEAPRILGILALGGVLSCTGGRPCAARRHATVPDTSPGDCGVQTIWAVLLSAVLSATGQSGGRAPPWQVSPAAEVATRGTGRAVPPACSLLTTPLPATALPIIPPAVSSQALAVRLQARSNRGLGVQIALRTLSKLGVRAAARRRRIGGQISEGEGEVHGDFSAGGERNKAGVKPCRVSEAQAGGERCEYPTPSPRGLFSFT